MKNVNAYSTYNIVFTRILGRLVVGNNKDRILTSIKNKEDGLVIEEENNLAENLHFAHKLTLKSLVHLDSLPSNTDLDPQLELSMKIDALMVFLEMKDLVLPRDLHRAIYPSGERGEQIFDPTGEKFEKIWTGNLLSLLDGLNKIFKSRSEEHVHDCDNCEAMGNCPIKSEVRAMKGEVLNDETILTQTIHIVPPKSSQEIN